MKLPKLTAQQRHLLDQMVFKNEHIYCDDGNWCMTRGRPIDSLVASGLLVTHCIEYRPFFYGYAPTPIGDEVAQDDMFWRDIINKGI